MTFVKIMGDTDLESRALMKEWGVRVVPLFLLFRNGERIGEWSGAKADILKESDPAAGVQRRRLVVRRRACFTVYTLFSAAISGRQRSGSA